MDQLTHVDSSAIEKLVELGAAHVPLFKVEDHYYHPTQLREIAPTIHRPSPLGLSTLASFADYLAANVDQLDLATCVVHVEARSVELVGRQSDRDRKRDRHVIAKFDPPRLIFDQFVTREELQMFVACKCTADGDQVAIMEFLRRIKGTEVRELGDDGLSQSVTTKEGLQGLNRETVPNPATLHPRRTFPEIDQPPSSYVLRLKKAGEEILAGLFTAEDDTWTLAAVQSIKTYLVEAFAGRAIGADLNILA